MERLLHLVGAGVVTDEVAAITELVADAPGCEILPVENVAAQERLAALAIRAAHQAWTMSHSAEVSGEQIGLICVSAWGAIDATVGYLESMFEAGGKFASPRLFSRSVYSSIAAAVAIAFGLKGPCETLAFASEDAVTGALAAAWRLLAAERAERVLVVWAEQAAAVAHDLARRAATGLHKKEYARYALELGEGATAVMVSRSPGIASIRLPAAAAGAWAGKPFAMDSAAAWVRTALPKSVG
ncbi:MAG TPA: beta-ketoacyl synthase chain length factor [Phycisphaerae bacterium]|nr:beta-ketoacyl synthase chain length factor [Phycisphaerae bacterium]